MHQIHKTSKQMQSLQSHDLVTVSPCNCAGIIKRSTEPNLECNFQLIESCIYWIVHAIRSIVSVEMFTLKTLCQNEIHSPFSYHPSIFAQFAVSFFASHCHNHCSIYIEISSFALSISSSLFLSLSLSLSPEKSDYNFVVLFFASIPSIICMTLQCHLIYILCFNRMIC